MRAEASQLEVSTDATLSSNVVCDAVSVASNATLNLNGYELSTGGFSGGGAIASAKIDETPSACGCDLLEYVETPSDNSTSAQCYVDTGYKPTSTDRIEAGIVLGPTISGIQWLICASARTGSPFNRMDCYLNGSKLHLQLGNNAVSLTPTANAYYDIVLDGSKSQALVATTNKTDATLYKITASSFTPPNNIALFVQHGQLSRCANGCRIRYLRVFDSAGNQKVNMLPARNASGTVGFYDTVRRIFYSPTSASGGALTAGGDISYRPLSYVKTPASNTGTFVDTLYWPAPSDAVETKARFGGGATEEYLFGSCFSGATRRYACGRDASGALFFWHAKIVNAGAMPDYHYATSGGAKTTVDNGVDVEVAVNGATRDFRVDGVASVVEPAADAMDTTHSNFILFSRYRSYDNDYTSYASGCRMYRFRVTDTNGYVRSDLVPAKLEDSGAVGFYDTVRNLFLTAASGLLEGGEALPRDLTEAGGTCAMQPSSVYQGTVANLFNDNFLYKADSSHRVILYTDNTPLPLRVDYDFGEGNEKAVNAYRLFAGYDTRSPADWTLYGSNDAAAYDAEDDDAWTALDVRRGQMDWTHDSSANNSSECRIKFFANDTPYRYYRLKIEEQKSPSLKYAELVQIEYFRIDSTAAAGTLCTDVASGAAATNATVAIGGDLKVVKKGEGSFASATTNVFYTGGTEVREGEFVVAAPLATSMTLDEDATLGFGFASADTTPLLTLDSGSSFPSSLGVSLYRDGTFKLPDGGATLTTGYDFGSTTLNLLNRSDFARRLDKDGEGDIVAFGPSGFIISFR